MTATPPCNCGHDAAEHIHLKGACRHEGCGCFMYVAEPESHGERRSGGALLALGEWISAAIGRLEAAGTDCERPLHDVFRCQQCEACKRSALVLDGRRWIGDL